MSCEAYVAPAAIYDQGGSIDTLYDDGVLALGVSEGEGLDAPSGVTIRNDDVLAVPTVYRWEIESINGLVAFGISWDDTYEIFGSGLLNLYYLSDGRIVQNGAVVLSVPPLTVGDVLELHHDPAAETAEFFLNGALIA